MLDILADLNEPQREAVMHVDGPLLVLAGAGSGKTRVITRRVAWLIDQGIAPENVLAITFTNKAAEEMRQRVIDLNTPPGATVCTFHALCARLLREFASEAGIAQNYTIYDRNDQLKIAKQAVGQCNLDGSSLTPAAAHAAISNAKNELRSPQVYASRAGNFFQRNVAEIYRRYEALLVDNNALDFDDLLLRMAMLLRDRSDIREHLARRYRYMLIDEYQDTNHAQYVIAHGIGMDHENLCVTGDPDQSIYAWRGADINNILDFEHDYPNAKVVRLEENYRSVQPILTGASTLIAHNTKRKPKSLFTRRIGGEPVHILRVDDEHAEGRQVARRIEDYRIAGGAYGDVAIFYRLNSLSRVLEEALIRTGVPYRIARGVEFYNRKVIKDVLGYLKLLVNPADDLSCLRIINTPPRGIGSTTIKRLRACASGRGVSMLEAAQNAEQIGLGDAPARKVRAFADMMTSLAAEMDRNVRDILEEVIRRSGMESACLRKDDEDARQGRANLEELITSAAEFDEAQLPPAGGTTLAEYLQQVSLVSDVDHFEGGSGAVTLMTLHAAKGLEFPVVFIVGCEDGMLPFRRDTGGGDEERDIEDLEEERRLAFVGMTRAEEKLTLSSAQSRMIRGKRKPQSASQFFHEIGRDAVQVEDLTTEQAPKPRQRRGGFYADIDQRAGIEAFADAHEQAIRRAISAEAFCKRDEEHETPFPPEYEYLKPGCTVHHPKFGLGKILELAQPWPDTRATISFKDHGQKKIVLARTNIEMVD